MKGLSDKAKGFHRHRAFPEYKMSEIYSDPMFNDRRDPGGTLTQSLALQIHDIGLLNPITLRELGPLMGDSVLLAKGHKYAIVQGHRRYEACKMLGLEMIPAGIMPGTEYMDFKNANIAENQQRVDLSFYEEAMGLRPYANVGKSAKDIAKILQKSVGWVNPRLMLLQLPPKVQGYVKDGFLGPGDVLIIKNYPQGKQGIVADDLVGQALRGVKNRRAPIVVGKMKTKRSAEEIEEMQHVIREACATFDISKNITVAHVFSPQGNSLVIKFGAWCAGFIATEELYDSLEELVNNLGGRFKRPVTV